MYGLTSKCDKFVAAEDANYKTESSNIVCQGVYDLVADIKNKTMQDFVDKGDRAWHYPLLTVFYENLTPALKAYLINTYKDRSMSALKLYWKNYKRFSEEDLKALKVIFEGKLPVAEKELAAALKSDS